MLALLAVFALSLPGTLPLLQGTPGIGFAEGGVVHMGTLALHGENPYPDPVSDRAIAFLYPPLGPLLLGGASALLGGGLAAPRALNAFVLLLSAVVVALVVRRRAGLLPSLWAAAAWLASAGTFVGYFFFARVDALQILLTLGAVATGARFVASGRGLVFAALLAVAAILVKPIALAAPLGVVAALALRRDGRGLARYAAATLAPGAAVTTGLHIATSGESTRAMALGAGHFLDLGNFLLAAHRMFGSVDALLLLLLAALGARTAPRALTLATVLSIPLCILTASKYGGLPTALGPVFALGAALAGHAFVAEGPRWLRATAVGAALALPVASALAPSPAHGIHDLRPYLADARTWSPRSLDAVRVALAARPGHRVLVNNRQELAWLAGARDFEDLQPAIEADLAGHLALDRVERLVREKAYALVLADPATLRTFAADFREHGRAETATRLEAVADALADSYELVVAPRGIDPAWQPRP